MPKKEFKKYIDNLISKIENIRELKKDPNNDINKLNEEENILLSDVDVVEKFNDEKIRKHQKELEKQMKDRGYDEDETEEHREIHKKELKEYYDKLGKMTSDERLKYFKNNYIKISTKNIKTTIRILNCDHLRYKPMKYKDELLSVLDEILNERKSVKS